jgi:hypothetical protein
MKCLADVGQWEMSLVLRTLGPLFEILKPQIRLLIYPSGGHVRGPVRYFSS